MPDESALEEIAGSRISRRNLIKAGAIVGGTVWVAPVIDSFVTPAAALSTHYCCTCFNPVSSGVQPFQGEADDTPPSAATCAAFCTGVNGGYENYVWCGPSSAAFTQSNQVGSAGCYLGPTTKLKYATGCCTGTTGVPGTSFSKTCGVSGVAPPPS